MNKHNGHGQRRPDEIEAEIARTRSELDETLSALERRLTPGQLIDQGLGYLRGSGAKQYFDHLGESVKRDPVPLALVGIGLAWLMMSDRGRSRADAMPGDEPTMKERMAMTAHKASQAKEKAAEAAHATRDRAAQLADSARHQAERVRGGYQRLVHEQPLALGAVGLAVGALIAAATPRTRIEEEAFADRAPSEPRRADDGTFDREVEMADAAAESDLVGDAEPELRVEPDGTVVPTEPRP